MDNTEIFQDAAIIMWSSSTQYAGKSYINWGRSNGEKTEIEVEPYETGKYSVTIEGLDPATPYQTEIYFKQGGITGKKTAANFTTKSARDLNYPYIYLKHVQRNEDGSFPEGSMFPLRLFNAIDAEKVVWRMNGKEITTGKNGYYMPEESGEMTAEAIYPDGSRDKTAKMIILK